jgi:hypothetical protein
MLKIEPIKNNTEPSSRGPFGRYGAGTEMGSLGVEEAGTGLVSLW